MCDIETTHRVNRPEVRDSLGRVTQRASNIETRQCRGRDRYRLELIEFADDGTELGTRNTITTCSNHLQVGAQTMEAKRQGVKPDPDQAEIVLIVLPSQQQAA